MNQCEVPSYIYLTITIIGLALEAYLGKTDKVKSGSILELIFNLIIAIMRKKKE